MIRLRERRTQIVFYKRRISHAHHNPSSRNYHHLGCDTWLISRPTRRLTLFHSDWSSLSAKQYKNIFSVFDETLKNCLGNIYIPAHQSWDRERFKENNTQYIVPGSKVGRHIVYNSVKTFSFLIFRIWKIIAECSKCFLFLRQNYTGVDIF